jgi:hypothetical protein
MAGTQLTNTFDSYQAVGNREEIADKIWDTSPEKTPFYSMLRKESVKTVHPEWQTDTLETPDTDNAYVQGAEYTYDALDPTVRVGNYTQISRKTGMVSRTQEKTDKAGRSSEKARYLAKKLKELKIAQEVTLLSNQASSAGSSSTAPRLGGLPAWLETNASRGSGGADGGFNSSTGVVDAATNGTQRAFTKTLLDDNLESINNNGGSPTMLLCSNYVKRVFSTFMSDSNVAAFRTSLSGKKQGTIYGAADMYISDFGDTMVVPNVQVTRAGASIARNAFLIEPGKVSLGVFQPTMKDTPAKTSDAEKFVVLTEYTLLCKNEAHHGVIADLYGMTSSS